MKIISGGQTGVDRGALDAAIELGIPHGGWCPRGRLAEDGRIPDRYELVETESADYPVRTERNVRESDATLILIRERFGGGTELTRRFAVRYRTPLLLIDLEEKSDPADVWRWIADNHIVTLNVAGPRESQSPGIQEATRIFLIAVLAGRDKDASAYSSSR